MLKEHAQEAQSQIQALCAYLTNNNLASSETTPIFSSIQAKLTSEITSLVTTSGETIGCYHMLLMAINRSSDYSKIIHGIALMPTLEPVHVIHTLQNALSSMNLFRGNTIIQLDSIDQVIQKQWIMTDRQWLQDNMLCLLSNAIKFSSNGTAKIRVYLTSYPCSDAQSSAKPQAPAERMEGEETKEEMVTTDKIEGNLSHMEENNRIKTANVIAKFPLPPALPPPPPKVGQPMLRFEVVDEGIGIAPNECQTIFEAPDFTSEERKKQGGAGIGLYCLAERVKVLGGQFGVQSMQYEPHHGSLFWFTMPYTIAPLPLQSNTSDTHEKQHTMTYTATKSSTRLLVVDDSLPILKMLRNMLSKQGNYTIDTAKHGLEAVNKVKAALDKMGNMSKIEKQEGKGINNYKEEAQENKKPFDVILMDLQMPVMDGLEAIRHIRSLEQAQDQKARDPHRHLIIAMSANSDSATIQQAYAQGCDQFIPKPVNALTLQQLLAPLGYYPISLSQSSPSSS